MDTEVRLGTGCVKDSRESLQSSHLDDDEDNDA